MRPAVVGYPQQMAIILKPCIFHYKQQKFNYPKYSDKLSFFIVYSTFSKYLYSFQDGLTVSDKESSPFSFEHVTLPEGCAHSSSLLESAQLLTGTTITQLCSFLAKYMYKHVVAYVVAYVAFHQTTDAFPCNCCNN